MAYVEVHGLKELIGDLQRAESRSVPAVTGVVEKGALNVKEDWAKRWSGIAHAPAIPASVTYDVAFGLGSVSAEIGPDKAKRQGALGNLFEYGSSKNAPIPGGLPALDTERPRFEKALGDLGSQLLSP